MSTQKSDLLNMADSSACRTRDVFIQYIIFLDYILEQPLARIVEDKDFPLVHVQYRFKHGQETMLSILHLERCSGSCQE